MRFHAWRTFYIVWRAEWTTLYRKVYSTSILSLIYFNSRTISGKLRRKKQWGQFVIISISGDMPPTPQPFLCPRLDGYISKLAQIHFTIRAKTSWNLDKYILEFGQIHIGIWTNWKFNKCISASAAAYQPQPFLCPRLDGFICRSLPTSYLNTQCQIPRIWDHSEISEIKNLNYFERHSSPWICFHLAGVTSKSKLPQRNFSVLNIWFVDWENVKYQK